MEARKKVFGNDKSKTGVRKESEESDPATSASISEAFIFRLSEPLGGRSEVVNTKMVELLKHMDMSVQKDEQKEQSERVKMWINYLSMVHAQPLPEKATAQAKKNRDDFIKSMQPEQPKLETKAKVYDWDFERLKRIQQEQERR